MRIGFTCGAWDLLHPGHLYFLRECLARCDKLIIGLQTNPSTDRKTKNKPIQTIFERYYQLSNMNTIIDGATKEITIIPYDNEKDLENLLSMIPFHVRFLGTDYIEKPYTGDKINKEHNLYDMEYIPRYHTYSSSELRTRVLDITYDEEASRRINR